MPEPAEEPAKHGRSLVGFYVTLGAVVVAAGLGLGLWKPVSARLAFHRLWNRGASLTILDQALEEPYRRTVYRQLLTEKAASPRLKDRLEAHKLRAGLDTMIARTGAEPDALLAAHKALEASFAKEVQDWLLSQGRESSAVVTVEMNLDRCTSSTETVGPTGVDRQVREKKAIPHRTTMSVVIILRDNKECTQAELDRLREGLGREFGAEPARIALVIWRTRKAEESPK